jgi:hypothetical protein
LEERQPARALELLLAAGRPSRDPVRARRFARALVESDQPIGEIEEATDEVVRGEQPSPAVPVAFLRGLLDARPPTAERAGWVADRAQKLLADWPNDPSARRVLADALYRQSELSDPPWAVEPARSALRAYQGLPAAHQAEPAVATAVAALHLNALRDPSAALRAVAPLRHPTTAAHLGPAQAEVLAAVLTANGDPAGAIGVLTPACAGPAGGSAGCWVQLARAYHATGRLAEARAALRMAANVPDRTSREEADRREAERLLDTHAP